MDKSKYSFSISGEELYEIAEELLENLDVPKKNMKEAIEDVLSSTLDAIKDDIVELISIYAEEYAENHKRK